MSTTYYVPSGKIPIIGAMVTLVVAAVVPLVMAVPYAVALVYNPSAYLGIVLPGLMGGAIGFGVAKAGTWMKVRNAWALVGVAVLSAMACWLLSWVPWEYFTLSHIGQDIDLQTVLWPPTFLELFAILYENGAWTIGRSGEPVSGFMLLLVWMGEAGIVLVASGVAAWAAGSAGVFCETCERWCKRVSNAFVHGAEAESQITSKLAVGDLGVLTSAPRTQPSAGQWIETAVLYCECGATNTLLVERCLRKVDRRGNARVERKPIVKHALITKAQADWARNGR